MTNMSTTKVIFTYKRKRLSSCSGIENGDVSPAFSSDVHIGKHQAAPKERLGSPEKDPMIFEGVNDTDMECSMDNKSCLEQSNLQVKELPDNASPQLHGSIAVKENCQVQTLDTCSSRDLQLGSTESSEHSNCKASCKNVSTEATLQETSQLVNKDLCLDLDSSRSLNDGCVQGGLVSQPVEQPNSLSEQKSESSAEVSKCKSTAPILTFSRRLKRKVEAGGSEILEELPTKEGPLAIRESGAICVPLSVDEKSPILKVASDDIVTGNTSCVCGENMTGEECRDSSAPCTGSSAGIPVLRRIEEERFPQDDVAVDMSSLTKQGTSALSGSDAVETSNLQKDISLRASDDELHSTCDDFCKTNGQHVSKKCRTSSADSQLTSSDCSDVRTYAEKELQQTQPSASMDLSCPPSGARVIDCNVIPESDSQEKDSDTVEHSSAVAESHGKVMQEGKPERMGLELFGDTDLQAVDLPSSHAVRLRDHLHTPMVVEKKPETKCLQLFSEDGHSGQLAPASTSLETDCRREMGQLEQASRKASATVGLSLGMEPLYEGQTSRHNSGMHLFRDHNISIREFIQNPAVQLFPDQSSLMLRHKVLLDSCDTRATALRGNRNISLDRFEPRPTMWSEEELDSLWIGIRRHGRGNWHAMLLDPKLRFAPWRVARDLADQFGREQCKLLTGQQGSEERCLKQPDTYNVDSRGHFMHPHARAMRENLLTEPHLSLGDVYARREESYFRSHGQNQSHMYVTVASKVGNFGSTSSNTMQTSVMVGRDGFPPDGRGMGLAVNNHLPHWLREPNGTSSRSFEPSPQVSAMPQTGGSQVVHPFSDPSDTSYGRRNLNNYKVPGTMTREVQPPGGLQRGSCLLKTKAVKTENLIVIDSDASSEETISDDQSIRT